MVNCVDPITPGTNVLSKFAGFPPATSLTCTTHGPHVVFENQLGNIESDGTQNNAIFFYSFGKFAAQCQGVKTKIEYTDKTLAATPPDVDQKVNSNCGGTPLATGEKVAMGTVNEIPLNPETIIVPSSYSGSPWPIDRFLYNVYANGSTPAGYVNTGCSYTAGATPTVTCTGPNTHDANGQYVGADADGFLPTGAGDTVSNYTVVTATEVTFTVSGTATNTATNDTITLVPTVVPTLTAASDATLNYVSEVGYICKPQTASGDVSASSTPPADVIQDPSTGTWYHTEIRNVIEQNGFFAITDGAGTALNSVTDGAPAPEGSVAHPAGAILAASSGWGTSPYDNASVTGIPNWNTDPTGYCQVSTTDSSGAA